MKVGEFKKLFEQFNDEDEMVFGSILEHGRGCFCCGDGEVEVKLVDDYTYQNEEQEVEVKLGRRIVLSISGWVTGCS